MSGRCWSRPCAPLAIAREPVAHQWLAVVIIDNLGSHEGDAVRGAVAAAELRFLPPDSPAGGPIEDVVAAFDARLGKVAARARDARRAAVADAIGDVTRSERENCSTGAGCEPDR